MFIELENSLIGVILTPINYLKNFNFIALDNLLFPEKQIALICVIQLFLRHLT